MAERVATSHLQFGLRPFLISVAVVAVCIFQWQNLIKLSFGYFYLLAFALAFAMWLTGQRIRGAASRWETCEPAWLPYCRVAALWTLLACLGSLWVVHRWCEVFDENWPLPFPFPDESLLAYHDWLEDLNPDYFGPIKPSGGGRSDRLNQYFPVLLRLNMVALSLITLSGLTLGLASRTTGLFGMLFWRDYFWAAFRRFMLL